MDIGAMWEWALDWLGDARNIIFGLIAVTMMVGAVLVVTVKNMVHAALMLMLTLAGSAALFLMLGAEFLAWVVVLVYLGAVIVLFLFGLMITRAPTGKDPAQLDHKRRWPAALIALATFATLSIVMVSAFGDTRVVEGVTPTAELGELIFTRFVIPFEAVSFVLLAALIGGIVLARRDPKP